MSTMRMPSSAKSGAWTQAWRTRLRQYSGSSSCSGSRKAWPSSTPMVARGPPLAFKLRIPSRPRARLWRRSARPIPATSPWKLISSSRGYRPARATGLSSESAPGAHLHEILGRVEVVQDRRREHLDLEQRARAGAKDFQGQLGGLGQDFRQQLAPPDDRVTVRLAALREHPGRQPAPLGRAGRFPGARQELEHLRGPQPDVVPREAQAVN